MRNGTKKMDDKNQERRLITPAQRRVGLGLIIVGVFIGIVGLLGYLAGDWQIAPFADLADQVFIAREVALSAGTGITGAFDMDGEESGVHVYYAALSEDDAINVETFLGALMNIKERMTPRSMTDDRMISGRWQRMPLLFEAWADIGRLPVLDQYHPESLFRHDGADIVFFHRHERGRIDI